jgi:hypothetical protein
MNSPIFRRTVSLAASVLVTFAVVELIANYALPTDAPQLLVQADNAAATPAAALGAAR